MPAHLRATGTLRGQRSGARSWTNGGDRDRMGLMISLILWGAAAASLGVIAYLGAARRLPRNRWAGMRTRATLASDESWAAGHRASARATALASAITLAAGALDTASNFDNVAQRRFTLVVGIVIFAVVCVGGIQADRAARDVEWKRSSSP